MPVEIRELIIKTEIKTVHHTADRMQSKQDISRLKNEVLDMCKRMISESKKREKYQR